jgi:DNA replicative helicase MCM subunit Mcm2 (Cdc46/Mcm family)
MRCDSCGFPVEGAMKLSARGSSFMSAEISAGDSRDRAWGGYSRSLEQHLLFDAPARPPGDEVTVTGTLTVRGARAPTGAPVKGAPAPTMHVFRLTVTN